MERVDQDFLAWIDGLDDEVPRQADADDFQAGALADRDRHSGQRDRNAEPAFQNGVEIAVARIVVIAGIAAKAHFVKEIAAKTLNLQRKVPAQVGAHFMRHRSQFVEMGFHIQMGKLVAREQKRNLGEVQWSGRITGESFRARIEM